MHSVHCFIFLDKSEQCRKITYDVQKSDYGNRSI